MKAGQNERNVLKKNDTFLLLVRKIVILKGGAYDEEKRFYSGGTCEIAWRVP